MPHLPLLGIVYQPEQYHRPNDVAALQSMRSMGIRLYPHSYGSLGSPSRFILPAGDGVIPDIIGVMGSIRYLRDAPQWMPGNLKWFSMFTQELHYYHRYQHQIPTEMLLNGDGLMLPFAEIKRRGLEKICAYWDCPSTDGVFVRPDQALKVCEAEVVLPDTWEDWCRYREKHTGIDGTSLMWCAPVRSFDLECRCLVVNQRIESISSYHGLGVVEPQCIDEQQEIIQAITPLLKNIELMDVAYMLDVARTSEGGKVIELNCLSSSGLYSLRPSAIASAWKTSLLHEFSLLTSD